jgi:hypothetical protein
MLFGLFGKKPEVSEKDLIGEVVHYFPKVKAAVIQLTKGDMSPGDQVRIKGHTTDFVQKIASMQVDHKPVEKAAQKSEVAIQVKKRTRRGDKVYIVR